ncbi:MAG TPA: response regulator [Ktedonobacteraceae bacterium]|nr:response regulator [Ktedonobacteraceae bacterium]
MPIGLLEDDAAIQEMLRLVLQDEGYAVVIYPDATAALEALLPGDQAARGPLPIDLLIVDWRLHGSISGTEVIRRLREVPEMQALPIVLTTAASFNDIPSLQGLNISFLEKPFEVDQMVDMVRHLLQSHSQPDPDLTS